MEIIQVARGWQIGSHSFKIVPQVQVIFFSVTWIVFHHVAVAAGAHGAKDVTAFLRRI